MSLEGKHALVTGAGSGIGRGITLKFLAAGAAVLAVDLFDDRLASLKEDARDLGVDLVRIATLAGDGSDYDFASAAVSKMIELYGKLDILVNNAGGSYGVGGVNFVDMGKKAWDITIAGNLYTTLNFTKHALPHMIKSRRGKIVNIGSTTGMGDSADGGDTLAVYAACKAGIIMFTKAIAREVAQYNINVNCISPGIVRTRVFERLSKEYIETLVNKTPLGRIGEPEDIAKMALYLVSDESSFMTGNNFCVTGGLVMH